MATNPGRNVYPPKRGNSANAQTPIPEYPRRVQPIQDAEEEEFPSRGKPISEQTAPARRLPPNSDADANDLPPPHRSRASQEPDEAEEEGPRRGKPYATDPDDAPPRRGRPPQQTHEPDERVAYPKRGEPIPSHMLPDDGGDLPQRCLHLSNSASVEGGDGQELRTSHAITAGSVQAAPQASDDRTTDAVPEPVVFKSGTDAAEMEIILKMIELKIISLNFTTVELASLASLTATLAENVGRLAKQMQAGGRKENADHSEEEQPPEPVD